MTRVLVVDDSQFFRTVVGNALSEDGYTVETADDGSDAVDTVATFDPDVVTMDVEMPGLNGIDAVERIMTTNPTPVIMASAYTEAKAEATLDALEAGAVDVVQKPDGSGSRNIAHFVDDVREKIDQLADADTAAGTFAQTTAAARAGRSRARISPSGPGVGSGTDTGSGTGAAAGTGTGSGSGSTRAETGYQSGTTASTSRSSTTGSVGSSDTATGRELESGELAVDESVLATSDPATDRDGADEPTIIIGASTGGPKVVEQLCERLPTALDARVFVVQHMPADFTGRFAERLDARSSYDVTEAQDGDWVGPGDAVVAPGGTDLEITTVADGALRVRLVDDGNGRSSTIQPSIDVTMQTAAEHVGSSLCGVVLTGMGRDGAAGIEAVKAAGGHTIAQDESTSPVFGIPCQAIETGCVDTVAPASEIVDEIVTAFTGESDD